MRRILLLITDLQIGGTPTVVRELAIRLNRSGAMHVEVACLSKWGPVADQLRDAGVAVHALDARGARDLPRTLARLVRLVRRGAFDTVFSFLLHANAVAAASSIFLRNVRFLQSIQTTQPTPWWHWRVQRLVAGAAVRIVVPSESVATVSHDWAGIARDRIDVIPNAIDPADWPPSKTAATTDVAMPLAIGFIGRLDRMKRVPHLLDAIPKVEQKIGRPIHVHIFGEGAERKSIEAHIARHNLGAKATLHGAIARPQVALDRIAILVLPSIAEGFGLVLIEAMASNVPVVAMRVPGPVNVVRDGETGLLVDPSSTDALATAVARLATDADLRKRLTADALTDVARRYSWEATLPSYVRLLGNEGSSP
jgi:glycosyltransferase involved in cell wall biosynthesis